MWWFIIYFVIAYAIFTLFYFYCYENYIPNKECEEWKRILAITLTSMILGILWIFIPIIIIFYQLYKLK